MKNQYSLHNFWIFIMIKNRVECWANAGNVFCLWQYCFVHLQSIVWYIYKYCFIHYKNYNVHVYYKHCFAHLQDDLLINLVIEQMINDTDPGTSSWHKLSDTPLVCYFQTYLWWVSCLILSYQAKDGSVNFHNVRTF